MRIVELLGLFGLVACARPDVIEASKPTPIATHRESVLDATPKQHRRMVQPEVFLRAYLMWFGGLAPLEVQRRGHTGELFDQWRDYLGALGLPDYHVDNPRATQSNTVMLAALGRLGEALCVRAVEHDLRDSRPVNERTIFAFEERAHPTLDDFTPRFDVLHRTFLGYPAELAPPGRVDQFFALYQQVAAHHVAGSKYLTSDQTAWAAVCSALVQHPETELY